MSSPISQSIGREEEERERDRNGLMVYGGGVSSPLSACYNTE
jgi:hypothetical protein